MAVVHALAQGLAQQPGVEVGVAAAAVGVAAGRERDGAVTVFRTPVPRYPRVRWYRPLRRTLAGLVTAFGADVVHGHGTGYNAAAALDAPAPALLTVHGVVRQEAMLSGATRLKERLVWQYDALFEDRVLRRAQHAVAISPYVRRAFAGYRHIIWHDAPNPVDEACFAVVRRPQPGRLLIPARVIPRKGIDTAIAALAHLPDGAPSALLVIAGETDTNPGYVEQCRRLAVETGVAARVQFLGSLSRPALLAELATAQAVVLPARQETAPVAVAEALAAGCPVVATAVGGLPDMVAAEETGLLVEPDHPAALAGALARILNEPATAEAWGQAGRRQAERYRLEVVVARTLALYDLVAGRRA
jgi:glycosyltransferase involved in cell wall biosynthesis